MTVSFITTLAEQSDAELTGDGSADNPYSGHVTELDRFAWYEIGTTFDVTLTFGDSVSFQRYGSLLGLTWEEVDVEQFNERAWHLYGTIESSGTCNISYIGDIEVGSFTINVKQDYDNPTYSGNYLDVSGLICSMANPDELTDDGLFEITLDYGPYVVEDLVELLESMLSMEEKLCGYFLSSLYDITDVDFLNGVVTIRVEPEGAARSVYPWVPTYLVDNGSCDILPILEFRELYDDYTQLIPEPTREGYTFVGWFEDPECTKPWVFRSAEDWIDAGLEGSNPVRFIYAGWESNETGIISAFGSGTEEDPYSGRLTNSTSDRINLNDIYIDIGTELDLYYEVNNLIVIEDPWIDEGFGLTLSDYGFPSRLAVEVSGTVSNSGTFHLYWNGEPV